MEIDLTRFPEVVRGVVASAVESVADSFTYEIYKEFHILSNGRRYHVFAPDGEGLLDFPLLSSAKLWVDTYGKDNKGE